MNLSMITLTNEEATNLLLLLTFLNCVQLPLLLLDVLSSCRCTPPSSPPKPNLGMITFTNGKATHLLLLAFLNCVQLPLLLLDVFHSCRCSCLNINRPQGLEEAHCILLDATQAA